MRILCIGLLYPPHQLGGYELVCDGTMRSALMCGHSVRVLVSDYRSESGSADEDADVPVYRELRSYLDASCQHVADLSLPQRFALERHNGATLQRHLCDFAPDVVSWWAMGGMSLSLIERVRRAGLPSVLVIQDTWPAYAAQSDAWTRMTLRLPLRSHLRAFERLSGGVPLSSDLEHAGRFLFNSVYTRMAVEQAGVRPSDATVLTPGVHARFQPPQRWHDWSGRLLYVGRLTPAKGVDAILPALATLPQATLRLIGSGEAGYEARLRSTAAALGVLGRIDFAGAASACELPAQYAAADTVIFPVRWEEPWGLVPLEAMAVGTPVVATLKGGAATYLRHEHNALIVPPDNPDALAAAVLRLRSDPSLRERLRLGGLETAAKHSAASYEQAVVREHELAAAARS